MRYNNGLVKHYMGSVQIYKCGKFSVHLVIISKKYIMVNSILLGFLNVNKNKVLILNTYAIY